MRKSWFGIAAASSLAWPAVAQAQALVWVDQAYERLQLEPYSHAGRDMVDWFAGRVTQGNAWTMTIVPQDYGYYIFSGACDHDCSQFSITVLDYRGEEVASARGVDGHSSASAYLTAGQSYTVQFYPEDCSAGFCYTIGLALQ